MIKYILAATLLVSTPAQAKTVEEVLSAATPEEQGLAIITEVDDRDFGFGDLSFNTKMTLENSNGETSIREMRNQVFEITDKSVGDKSMIIFDKPRDVSGTAFLTFSKVLKPDDQWLYLPALKRVKRISSKNKSGPFVGSEFAYEDISSQEVGKYDYKYLASEKCPASAGDCFKVEQYPNYENSGYTKIHSYIDQARFIPVRTEFYDRKDELLKTLDYFDYNQYLGQYWRADKFIMTNHQNGKKTELEYKNYKFRTNLKEGDFVKGKLKNAR